MPIRVLQVKNSDLICVVSFEGAIVVVLVDSRCATLSLFVTHGIRNINLKHNTVVTLKERIKKREYNEAIT
jgi:hypothetical protein